MSPFSRHTVPFARWLIPFMAGIAFSRLIPLAATTSLILVFVPLLLVLLISLIRNPLLRFRTMPARGILMQVAFLAAGTLLAELQNPWSDSGHYGRFKNIEAFVIRTGLQITEKNGTIRAESEVLGIYDGKGCFKQTSGLILLRLKNEAVTAPVQYGNIYLASGPVRDINGPANPGDFDYRSYMRNKGIGQSIQPGKEGIRLLERSCPAPVGYMLGLRDRSLKILSHYMPDQAEKGVSEALLFGIRDHLDPEMMKTFSDTGTLHVLAVSGLHVGLIYMALAGIFSFLGKGKKAKTIRCLLNLTCLWTYALLTGLSPSVLRAVIMFSMLDLGRIFRRSGGSMNTLLASAFLLLVSDTSLLFDAGFQLSYAAVAGILVYHTPLSARLRTRFSLLNRVTEMLSLTISAQLFTFPLSLYYFGGFPLYFIPGNLIVVPAFTIILLLVIVLMPLSGFTAAAEWISGLASGLIRFCHVYMSFLSDLPNAVLKGFYADPVSLLLFPAITALILYALRYRNKRSLFGALSLVLLMTAYLSCRNIHASRQRFIAVHHFRGHDVFSCIDGHTAIVVSDSDFFKEGKTEKYMSRFFMLKKIHAYSEYRTDKKLVSTNFMGIENRGFQFFDKILTIEKSQNPGHQKGRNLWKKKPADRTISQNNLNYISLIFKSKDKGNIWFLRRRTKLVDCFTQNFDQLKYTLGYCEILVGE